MSGITALLIVVATGVEPPVAETTHFSFRSTFGLCLHDFLHQWVAEEAEPATLPATLSAEAAEGWRAAEAHYRAHIKNRHHRLDDLMFEIRARQAGLALDFPPTSEAEALREVLEAAAPAYRAHWWPEHDARNRRWVEQIVPLVRKHEATLTKRLARDYQHRWPEGRMPVDVVTYAGWAGANTMREPNHVMISSANEGYRGRAGFEMVFHEASHTIMGGRTGRIAECLRASSRTFGKDPPPNLWHAILFVTAGEEVRRVLAADGVTDYEPYVYRNKLFDRAWGPYRAPIERHWPSYLDGKAALPETIERIVTDLLGEPSAREGPAVEQP